MGWIAWILIGLVAGLLARLLVPGPQPMGCLWTVLLGLAGSLMGGFLSSVLFGVPPDRGMIHATGFWGSTIGAIVVLLLYGYMQKRR